MKVTQVSATYGELRSTGFPAFTNKRVEVSFSATIEPGETARAVEKRLLELAKREVVAALSGKAEVEDELDIPF